MYDNNKIFVDVIAKFSNGKIMPMFIIWTDGRKYEIDKILDVRKGASLKSGGVGLRYTIRIKNTQKYLFQDENMWFIESS